MSEKKATDKLNPGAVVRRPGSSMENKTGSWRTSRPAAAEGRCTGCGICMLYCPENCIKIINKNGKKQAEIGYDYCKGCLICVAECPSKALVAKKEGE